MREALLNFSLHAAIPSPLHHEENRREGGYGRLSWTITLVVKDCVAYQIPCVMNAGPQSYKREEKLIYLY